MPPRKDDDSRTSVDTMPVEGWEEDEGKKIEPSSSDTLMETPRARPKARIGGLAPEDERAFKARVENRRFPGGVTPRDVGRLLTREYVAKPVEDDDMISFTDKETPFSFLVTLGYPPELATEELKDDEFNRRMQAAIVEARVHVTRLPKAVGTLLYTLAKKCPQKAVAHYIPLVEAIVNGAIANALQLAGVLQILELVDEGYVTEGELFELVQVSSSSESEDEAAAREKTKRLLKPLTQFVMEEAEKAKLEYTHAMNKLVRSLASRYQPGLEGHLHLICRYIGQGILKEDVQLGAAIDFLLRSKPDHVNITDLENYCSFSKSKR